jgi:hypothetical protein
VLNSAWRPKSIGVASNGPELIAKVITGVKFVDGEELTKQAACLKSTHQRYCQMFGGATLGMLVLREPITVYKLVGIGLATASIYFITTGPGRH